MALTKEQREREIQLMMAENNKLSYERAAQTVDDWSNSGLYDEPQEQEEFTLDDVVLDSDEGETLSLDEVELDDEPTPTEEVKNIWTPAGMEVSEDDVLEARRRDQERYQNMTPEEVQAELEAAQRASQEPSEKSIWDTAKDWYSSAQDAVSFLDPIAAPVMRTAGAIADIPSTVGATITKGLHDTPIIGDILISDEDILDVMDARPDLSPQEARDLISSQRQRSVGKMADAISYAIPMSAGLKAVTVPAKLARGAAIGAGSEAAAELADNIRYEEELLKDVGEAALTGALFGTAGEAIAPAYRAITGPSRAAKKVQQAADEAFSLRSNMESSRAASQKLMSDISKMEASTISSADRATIDVLADMEVLNIQAKKSAARGLSMSPAEEASLMKYYDDAIADIEAKRASDISALEESVAKRLEDRGNVARETSNAIYERYMNTEVAPGVTAKDFIAASDKMGVAQALKDRGAAVTMADVAEQVNDPALASYLRKQRSLQEKVRAEVPFLSEGVDLSSRENIANTKRAIESYSKDMVGTVDNVSSDVLSVVKEQGLPSKSTEDAIDALKQRANLVSKGKYKEAKAFEGDFIKSLGKMTEDGVPGTVRDELNSLSRDFKTLNKFNEGVKVAEKKDPTFGRMVSTGIRQAIVPLGWMSDAGVWAAKKVLGGKAEKWNVWSSKRRFEEMNKAFQGKLKWTPEAEVILSKEGDAAKAISRVLVLQMMEDDNEDLVGVLEGLE